MARARCGVTASRFVGVASKWVPAVPKEGLRCSSTRRLDFMASAIHKSRGRWGSDIAFIYPRVSTQQQFAASLRMTGVSDVALETAVPSWTQGRG